MSEDYVSLKVAKILKDKGFDLECIGYYVDYEPNDVKYSFLGETNSTWEQRCYSAPTHQMVLAWLREEHKIHIEVEVYFCEDGQSWLSKIQRIDYGKTTLLKTCLPNTTYEEAIEAAIKYVLENLI